jgi:hypothetical protein
MELELKLSKKLMQSTQRERAKSPRPSSAHKWTKNVDIFRFDFLVIPINEAYTIRLLFVVPLWIFVISFRSLFLNLTFGHSSQFCEYTLKVLLVFLRYLTGKKKKFSNLRRSLLSVGSTAQGALERGDRVLSRDADDASGPAAAGRETGGASECGR